MKDLKSLSIQELKSIVIDLYDGNAGEMIHGYEEMGIRGDRLKSALISDINRAGNNSGFYFFI
jgi:hypothetical protein